MVDPVGSGGAGPQPDPGLDSVADVRVLTRLLLWGLVAVLIAAFVALLVSGRWAWAVLIVVPYVVVSVVQWRVAIARQRARRAEAGLR